MPPEGSIQRSLPMQTRDATIAPASINEETRTVELVWSTGAKVRRFDWWNERYYDEELSLEPSSVDLSRLQSGAPLLNSHASWNLTGQIGVVEKAWLAKGEGRALVRFSKREDVDAIWQDVKGGIIRNVSVGYMVRKYEIVKEEGQVDLYRAVEWTPMEISLVSVPADAGAGTRGEPKGATYPCMIVNRAAPAALNPEVQMDPTENPAGNPANLQERGATATPPATTTTTNPPAQPSPEELTRRATEAERNRVTGIQARVRSVNLPDEVATDLITRGIALEHIGNHLVDEIAKRGATPPIRPRVEGGQDNTDPIVKRNAMIDCLAARAAQHVRGVKLEMTEQGRAYAGFSMLDMAAELMRSRGEQIAHRIAPAQLYMELTRAGSLSTSDFPYLLAASADKVLRAAYAVAAPTYKIVFGRKTFTDFKPKNFVQVGDFPNLLEKDETGEFQSGAIGEGKQTLTLATYGRVLNLSRRTIINDDLNAFAQIPAMIARRVSVFENVTAWAVIAGVDGPTIADTGRALFNTTDKTKANAGAAIGITTVSTGRAAIRMHQSLDGEPLNITPRFLVTGPDKETEAEQFCSLPIVAATDATANPFKGRLTPVSDAALGTGNAWHLLPDPSEAEVLVYGHLEGAEGPQIMTRDGFTTDGVDIRVLNDFVAGAMDFRGAWKNPGN